MKKTTLLIVTVVCMTLSQAQDDPYLWLEDIEGDKALSWVKQQNNASTSVLESMPEFNPVFEKAKEILNSHEKIPYAAIRGDYVYNFWRDEEHVRGLWRRTTLKDYCSDEPSWQVLLDVDALAEAEDENWVYKGVQGLYPNYERFLISLSRGGKDATVIREFDPESKSFIPDGFYLQEAKSNAYWIDRNSIFVATDFGPGTLTTSGYPRLVKQWRRGTPLQFAEPVFAGDSTDVSVIAYAFRSRFLEHNIVFRSISYLNYRSFLYVDENLVPLDIPHDTFPDFFHDQLILQLQSDWSVADKTFPAGALIGINFQNFLHGDRQFQLIAAPDERSSIQGFVSTRNALIVNKMVNVRGELYQYKFDGESWSYNKVAAPDFGAISIITADDESPQYFFAYESFNKPSTLYLAADSTDAVTQVKQQPSWFDGEKYAVTQHEAVSSDGVRIPFFMVAHKNLKLTGDNPTILHGYGGFSIAQKPSYSGIVGTAWLERGGVYVVANIRGGDEFGPAWHRAAMREKRQQSFDDFIAVAEDLIARGITSPQHLGISGGSQGGLLVGVAFTQRPDLFNAVACGVPLLDMQRYNKLLAGASWMGEYGDPDKPEDWAFIQKYSPYHNVVADKEYPHVYFYTSTRDDRVHPGHARKMVARMKDMGHTVYYYENIEGGHGAAANNEQYAYRSALMYSYFWHYLK